MGQYVKKVEPRDFYTMTAGAGTHMQVKKKNNKRREGRGKNQFREAHSTPQLK